MQKRVLVVEDEKDFQSLIISTLKNGGYQVTLAGNGEQGLNSFESVRPDLVILDIQLPDIDGTEVCRRIKSDPKARTVPILMLTIQSQVQDIVKALKLGADDYMLKPFDPDVLLARIAGLLKRFQAHNRA